MGRWNTPQGGEVDNLAKRALVEVSILQVIRAGLLRRSDAAALRWGDVELHEDGSGWLHVVRSKTDQAVEGALLYLGTVAVDAFLAIRAEEAVYVSPDATLVHGRGYAGFVRQWMDLDMNESSFSTMDEDGGLLLNSPIQQADERPQVTFESITFSDGTTVEIEPNDVIVLVGPNNAGKSLALRELEDFVGGKPESRVLTSTKVRTVGTPESFEEFVRKNARVVSQNQGNSINIQGYGVSFGVGGSSFASMWPGNIAQFRPFFCQRIPTENRITGSNPPNAIDPLTENPSHPIHLLYDDRAEERLSEYFSRAFGQDLILYRAGGRRSPLLVGERPILIGREDRVSATYIERLIASTISLDAQGDGMRSFASVILYLLAPITPNILLLDEPEAFLHPPQARLLGEIIAAERSNQAQLFVATHSPDVLHGLIGVAPDHLRVLRMQRNGDVNRIKELDKEIVKEISLDPLMRYSSVLSGVFHERVIICEGDADCMFYSSILNIHEVHGGRYPDVLFTHAAGKHRIATLAKALNSLDVPVDAVVDIDVLNDMKVLQNIVESLGGCWAPIEPCARAVKTAVEEQKRPLSVAAVKKEVQAILDRTLDTDESLDKLKNEIASQIRGASPWEIIKSAGQQAFPPGEATRHFRELQSLCKNIGLWIVPVGEMEGFCKSIGGHGPRWVHEVIEQHDLASSTDLEGARNFVREIWMNRQNKGKGNQPRQLS